ncbi:hypothetical protein [Burkholderia stabilis]|uniref:hypothetical protein n=1 Tax=Burkholderia stabilis TaxID=95485 RepID=UPI001F4AC903|nr:hypothetical protein [Burkholderia stabilis]
MKTRDLAAAAVIAGVAALPVSSWADTATSPFDTASHPVPDRPAANASGSPAHRATANVEDDYLTDFTNTIGGIDSDGDGVRDDVRKYIDDQYPDPIQRAAMLRYAAAQRDFMMRGESRASAVDGLTRVFRSLECLRQLMGQWGSDQSQVVFAMMLNTKERWIANGHAMVNASGHVYMQSRDDPCAQ